MNNQLGNRSAAASKYANQGPPPVSVSPESIAAVPPAPLRALSLAVSVGRTDRRSFSRQRRGARDSGGGGVCCLLFRRRRSCADRRCSSADLAASLTGVCAVQEVMRPSFCQLCRRQSQLLQLPHQSHHEGLDALLIPRPPPGSTGPHVLRRRGCVCPGQSDFACMRAADPGEQWRTSVSERRRLTLPNLSVVPRMAAVAAATVVSCYMMLRARPQPIGGGRAGGRWPLIMWGPWCSLSWVISNLLYLSTWSKPVVGSWVGQVLRSEISRLARSRLLHNQRHGILFF